MSDKNNQIVVRMTEFASREMSDLSHRVEAAGFNPTQFPSVIVSMLICALCWIRTFCSEDAANRIANQTIAGLAQSLASNGFKIECTIPKIDMSQFGRSVLNAETGVSAGKVGEA